jgi:hypothetical protein
MEKENFVETWQATHTIKDVPLYVVKEYLTYYKWVKKLIGQATLKELPSSICIRSKRTKQKIKLQNRYARFATECWYRNGTTECYHKFELDLKHWKWINQSESFYIPLNAKKCIYYIVQQQCWSLPFRLPKDLIHMVIPFVHEPFQNDLECARSATFFPKTLLTNYSYYHEWKEKELKHNTMRALQNTTVIEVLNQESKLYESFRPVKSHKNKLVLMRDEDKQSRHFF